MQSDNDPPARENQAATSERQLAAAISDAIVQLHVNYYGKGPTHAKTYINDRMVMCVLSNPFTTVEQTLIEVGRLTAVREMRQVFQDSMSGKFKKAVEELTQREVVAFMSQTHVGPDMAVEIFQLAS
jgi:uncharacterized protein YbcI